MMAQKKVIVRWKIWRDNDFFAAETMCLLFDDSEVIIQNGEFAASNSNVLV
jgi:hypothetical protein